MEKKNSLRLIILGLFITIVFTAILISYGWVVRGPGGTETESSIVWGIVFTESEDNWQASLQNSFESAAKSAGIKVISIYADRSQNSQITAIRSLIAFRADVISFSPIVSSGWENVMSEVCSAGIPILVFNKNISERETPMPIHYIGYDYIRAGELLAANILNDIPEDAILAELCGTTSASTVLEISRGLRNVLHTDRRWNIDFSVNTDYMQSLSKEMAGRLLNNDWSVDVVICHSDAITLGAIAAIEEAGLTPGEDILVYAIGGSPEVIRLVEAGKVNCLIQCDLTDIGTEAATCVRELMDNEAISQPATAFLPLTTLNAYER